MNLSFDSATEHIAPHPAQRQGQGRRALPSLPRLAVCCPPARPPARPPTPEWRGVAWPVPKLIRKPGAALLACSRLARHTAYPSDVGGAEKRCRQSPH
jgi:hypothetical protein